MALVLGGGRCAWCASEWQSYPLIDGEHGYCDADCRTWHRSDPMRFAQTARRCAEPEVVALLGSVVARCWR